MSPLTKSVLTAANALRLILFLIMSRMALATVPPRLQRIIGKKKHYLGRWLTNSDMLETEGATRRKTCF